jgi:hypothetical protein
MHLHLHFHQLTEGPIDEQKIVSIVPGKGQTTLSLFADKDSKMMAFPKAVTNWLLWT